MFPLQTLRLYPFLKLAIALILGMWLATGVDILHSWQWALAFVAVTIITLFLRRPLLQSLLLLFSVFLLGGTLMTRQLESIGDGYAADETIFDAVVASQPVMKKKVMQMDLWITSASEPIKVKASVFRDGRAERLKPGDGIRAKAPLEKPANYAKSTFDYRTYLLRQGYRSTVFLYITDWHLQRVSLLGLSLLQRTRLAVLQLRQQLIARYRSLGLSDDQLAVVSAMTLGDRSLLTSELKDDYSISGGAHILALSGMHLGIIYMVLTLVLGVRRPRNTWRFFFSSHPADGSYLEFRGVGWNVGFRRSCGGDADPPDLRATAQSAGHIAQHPCLYRLPPIGHSSDVAARCRIPAFLCIRGSHPCVLQAHLWSVMQ